MKNTNSCFNYNLNLLVKTLNCMGIRVLIKSENCLEIFFDDNQKEIVLNMLTQVDNIKNGFDFKVIKSGNRKIKSATVVFYRKPSLNCELLVNYLNSRINVSNINNFNKIDIILDSFSCDDGILSIKKNFDTDNEYLFTINRNISKKEFEGENNFVLNNSELSSRLVHTICIPNEDGTYNVSYRFLFQNENELNHLIAVENTNTKKLMRQNKNATLV